MAPISGALSAGGLALHTVTWEPDADAVPSGVTALLVHGFADAAGTWDLVAPALAARGHRVVAYDQRGFGRSPWVGAGGYYHFFDYVSDLDAVVRALAPARLALVGHSMGGTVCALWAGARPTQVHRLALLEGLGPPDSDPGYAPDRAARWLDDLGAVSAGRGYASVEEARDRLAVQHAALDPSLLASRVAHLVVERDGRFHWRMDPLHRTMSPVPFYAAAFRAFAARVTCPTLLVSGGPDGFHPADEAERARAFPHVIERELPGAGHMMHWTRPDDVARLLLEHIG
ncbi:MAG: alpha/beta hydrolase [Polyangiaceae bacterium]|nr:alpha/beta hydrolase [Polyangiaceae bacterium]